MQTQDIPKAHGRTGHIGGSRSESLCESHESYAVCETSRMADLDAIVGKSAVRISKWKERLLYIETIGPTVPFSIKRLSLTFHHDVC